MHQLRKSRITILIISEVSSEWDKKNHLSAYAPKYLDFFTVQSSMSENVVFQLQMA